MSTEGLIIGLIVVFVSGAWILSPLLKRSTPASMKALLFQKQRDRLLVHYERVLATIRDLDEDNNLGKINPDDYKNEREYWISKGEELLKALHEMDGLDAPVFAVDVNDIGDADIDQKLDDAIEAAIAERLQTVN